MEIVNVGMVLATFIVFALCIWFSSLPQRDVIETAETSTRVLSGTLLVLLQLACFTASGLAVLPACLESALAGSTSAILVGLTVACLSPVAISVIGLAVHRKVLWRRWRLRPVKAGHPVSRTVADLSAKLGLRRPVEVCRAAALVSSPFVIRSPFHPAVLVLPLDWDRWGTWYARNGQAAEAVRRFVLLHELSHVRNGDVFFMTWAGVFLWCYRLWMPVTVAIQLALLLTSTDGWWLAFLEPGIAATVTVYLLLRLLYLSVARQRELLADARARLYTGEEQISLLLHRSSILPERGAPRRAGSTWHTVARIARRMIRTLTVGWEPLAVLSALDTQSEEILPFLATHPPSRIRRRALQERSVIQDRAESVSPGAACWIGVVLGAGMAFLVLPFTCWFLVLVPDSMREALFIGTGLAGAIYPAFALCLPLRNALTRRQPLGPQVRQLLWRFAQLGLCYLVTCLLGYAHAYLVCSFAGLYLELLSLPNLVSLAFKVPLMSPMLAGIWLGLMRETSSLWNRKAAERVWIWAWAVATVGAVAVMEALVFCSDARLSSGREHVLLGSAVGGVAILVFVQAKFSTHLDIEKRYIAIHWTGRRRRVWRWEQDTVWGHWFWAGVVTASGTTVPTVAAFWLAGTISRAIYLASPAREDGVPILWSLFASAALLLGALLARARRHSLFPSRPSRKIGQRESFLHDAGRLAEVRTLLGKGRAEAHQALSHNLSTELLGDCAGAPSMRGWMDTMTVDTIAWVSTLVRECLGVGALSPGVVEYVEGCACAGGGFGHWPGGRPRLGATYHALRVFQAAGTLDRVDAGLHAGWIASRREAGGYRSPEHRRPSLQDTASAIQSLALLERLDLVDRAPCARWVEQAWLVSDRGLGQTRRAVVCLARLGAVTPEFVELLESSWLPRHHALVLNLRVDKQIGPVWDYVQVVAHLFGPSAAAFARWTEGLAENVAEGWENLVPSEHKR